MVPKVAEGIMKPASDSDIQRDEHGLTNPNLHRRLDIHEPAVGSEECSPRSYEIGIFDSCHSIRMTQINYHDEESTESEIP